MVKYLVKLIFTSGLMAAVIAVPLGWFFYQDYLQTEIGFADEGIVFTVPENSNLYSVTRELSLAGYLKYPNLLVWHARWQKLTDIKTGEYRFPADATPESLLEILNDGDVVQYSHTLIEGRTLAEILQAMHQDSRISATLVGKTSDEIVEAVQMDVTHPEGWFYPDTYAFSRDTSDVAILRQAHLRMQEVLAEEWAKRVDGLPLETAYEALILASIVEKETGAAHERPEIAGVFVRRLNAGMRLQTDPTIIYGLGEEFDGNLTRKHLTTDGPYNTYRNGGLPPTPIAAAGRAAINAALNPADGEALYFVARGDGTHAFSATLDEHNRAVQEFQIQRRAKNYRSSPE